MIIGAMFSLFIGVLALIFLFSFLGISALRDESKVFVDQVTIEIVKGWNVDALYEHSHPQFKKQLGQPESMKLWEGIRRLGKLEELKSSDYLSFNYMFKVMTATYKIQARFEKGDAVITVKMVNEGDSWLITSFHVDSPGLIEDVLI